jgi:hypothetical protein
VPLACLSLPGVACGYLTATHGQLVDQVSATRTHVYVALQAGGRGSSPPSSTSHYDPYRGPTALPPSSAPTVQLANTASVWPGVPQAIAKQNAGRYRLRAE